MSDKMASILDRMVDLGTERVDKTLLAQIYGKPGAGKTVLAVGLAKYIADGAPVIYLDSKENWVSLDNHPGLKVGVRRLQVTGTADIRAVGKAIASGAIQPGALVMDEFNTMADLRLDEEIRANYGIRPGEPLPSDFDAKLYKPVGDDLVKLLNGFQGLGVHTIITAHEREMVDHRKVKTLKPDYTPKTGQGIQKLLHLSAHLTNEITGSGQNTKYERKVQSHPSALVDAKSRIGGLPLSTDTATFVEVIHSWLYDEDAGLLPSDFAGEVAPDDLPSEGVPITDVVEPEEEPVDA